MHKYSPEDLMNFKLIYNIENHGWANATLQGNGEKYEIDCISYLSDAFAELSLAILNILNGEPEADCGFDHEPGRTKLRFINQKEKVLIQVYQFNNELMDEPWEKGKCVKNFQTEALRLKSQYLKEADKILTNLGVKEYEKRWGYPFPLQTYEQVKNIN